MSNWYGRFLVQINPLTKFLAVLFFGMLWTPAQNRILWQHHLRLSFSARRLKTRKMMKKWVAGTWIMQKSRMRSMNCIILHQQLVLCLQAFGKGSKSNLLGFDFLPSPRAGLFCDLSHQSSPCLSKSINEWGEYLPKLPSKIRWKILFSLKSNGSRGALSLNLTQRQRWWKFPVVSSAGKQATSSIFSSYRCFCKELCL